MDLEKNPCPLSGDAGLIYHQKRNTRNKSLTPTFGNSIYADRVLYNSKNRKYNINDVPLKKIEGLRILLSLLSYGCPFI
jgi:hypothetical protein